MLTINRKVYAPLSRIKEYTNADSERVLELAKEKKVRSFTVNGHIMVCLEDVKREASEWISTK